MKKYILAVSCFLTLTCIFSCNNDEKKTDEKEAVPVANAGEISEYNFDWINDLSATAICDSAGGAGNFLVSKTLGDSMINHFDTIYRLQDDHITKVRAFDSSYWIDACTVAAIAKFLKDSNRHDGIRIYFGCSLTADPVYGSNQYKKKTTLFIFPTKKRAATSPDMSEHGNELIQIPVSGCTPGSSYLKAPGNANPEIDAFNITYRKSSGPVKFQKDSLSQAVWIDSCVIYFIDNLLKNNSSIVDGINIRTAAYFENFAKPIKGRWKKNQSTIIIVPSSLREGKHEDNWDIITALKTKKKKQLAGAFNHGELCPKACD
jgi:hypothetical protein